MEQPQQPSVNIDDYKKWKAEQSVDLIVTGRKGGPKTYAMALTQYHQRTGKPVASTVIPLDYEQLVEFKTKLLENTTTTIAGIDELLADMKIKTDALDATFKEE